MGACQAGHAEWPDAVKEEVIRLWTARCKPFEPDSDDFALGLLRSYWLAMLPASEFRRCGVQWSSIGFQGKDPATDVRAGGLLSVMCLEHFATVYTFGARQMLIDLRRTERESGDTEHFYPLSTAAIVICSMLCDEIGISNGMRGPKTQRELDHLLAHPPRLKIAKLLTKEGRLEGFQELFSCALAHFHVQFLRNRSSYMESMSSAQAVVKELEERAQGCETLADIRAVYCASDPTIEQLLVKGGGEARGWRLARCITSAERAKQACTAKGILDTMKHLSAHDPAYDFDSREMRWTGEGYAQEKGFKCVSAL
eukprot:m.191364 g.191364  ORF g.191364 m.191364 type:complete len:312 (-) comp18317_c0_seq1:222-1157(-)